MHVRRVSFALVLAALAAVPALSRAQTGASGRGGPMQLGALIGFEDSDGPSGLALRFDGILDQKPLSPVVGLSLVFSVGYSRWHDELKDFFGTGWEATTDLFKFVPAARFTFGHSMLRPYADAGVGLYHARAETSFVNGTFGVTSRFTGSDTGVMFRFGGGVELAIAPSMSLGGELGLNSYLGDIDDSTFTAMFLMAFRL